MKKLLLILLCLPMIGFGQGWERFYGDSNIADEYGYCVRQTTDGGYIVTGFEGSPNGGANLCKVWLVKTDVNGDTIWTNKFGGVGLSPVSRGYSVQQTTDGGYIIAGYTEELGGQFAYGEVLLIKTDGNGQLQWLKNFGGTGYDFGYSVIQNTDGDFIVTGHYEHWNGARTYLIKTDANGDSIWTKTFGNGVGYSVQQTTDGGYIITGAGSIMKTNANGDSLWTKDLEGGFGESVQQTTDGGYIVAGYIYTTTNNPFGVSNTDIYLIKTDSNGDSIWTKKFGGINDDIGYCVQQTTDGGFIICGKKEVQVGLDNDVYLLKTDILGNEQWSKTFGSSGHDGGRFVQQTSDGGYILTGNWYNSLNSIRNEIYLIKTNGNGNVTSTFNIPINPNRKLQNTVDILGKETKPKTNTPLIEIYDDGTVEKRIVIE